MYSTGGLNGAWTPFFNSWRLKCSIAWVDASWTNAGSFLRKSAAYLNARIPKSCGSAGDMPHKAARLLSLQHQGSFTLSCRSLDHIAVTLEFLVRLRQICNTTGKPGASAASEFTQTDFTEAPRASQQHRNSIAKASQKHRKHRTSVTSPPQHSVTPFRAAALLPVPHHDPLVSNSVDKASRHPFFGAPLQCSVCYTCARLLPNHSNCLRS